MKGLHVYPCGCVAYLADKHHGIVLLKCQSVDRVYSEDLPDGTPRKLSGAECDNFTNFMDYTTTDCNLGRNVHAYMLPDETRITETNFGKATGD